MLQMMKQKTFTFADLRKAHEEAIMNQLLDSNDAASHGSCKNERPRLHRRRKVNCLCRCSPQKGIESLEPKGAQQLYDERLQSILNTGDPHQIADRAIQAGKVLQQSGRPRLALELMQRTLTFLLNLDEDWQWHYDLYGTMPSEEGQWNMPWSWRTAEADACRLAREIDVQRNEVNKHLGTNDCPRLLPSIHRHYEQLWMCIYDVSEADLDWLYPFRKPHDPLATFRRRHWTFG